MRKAMLPDNLIKRDTLFKRALLAICLGLLPSQVFATAQTCETYFDCVDLGYTQTSCNENSISLSCPFDNSKLFCVECTSDQIYNSANNKCEDGKTYCANQNKEFDGGKCVSCDNTETFDMTTMKCVHKCVANNWNEEVPSNNVCIKDTSLGVTCYKQCERAICEDFTGYVSGSTVISVNGGTIGIVRDDGYCYMPYRLKIGNFNYVQVSNEVSSTGHVLPEFNEVPLINGIDQTFNNSTYWTSTECDRGQLTRSDGYCPLKASELASSIVLLKVCARPR